MAIQPDSKSASVRKPEDLLKTGTLAAHPHICLLLLDSSPDIFHRCELREDPLLNKALTARRHKQSPYRVYRPRYSGLRVQGTADSPVSMTIFHIPSSYYIMCALGFQVFFR